MAADQNTHGSHDHAATPNTQPTLMINLCYVALGIGLGPAGQEMSRRRSPASPATASATAMMLS